VLHLLPQLLGFVVIPHLVLQRVASAPPLLNLLGHVVERPFQSLDLSAKVFQHVAGGGVPRLVLLVVGALELVERDLKKLALLCNTIMEVYFVAAFRVPVGKAISRAAKPTGRG
jgi:hypothetical protein